MVRLSLVGLGKMGISHLAIVRSHPEVELVAVCDSTPYVLDTVAKCMGIKTYSDYDKMLAEEKPDGVIVATPSKFHGAMVRAALDRDVHVFCEKPFCLDPAEGAELAELAQRKNLVNQVGYHYRFVGAFQEAKRLIAGGAIGRVHHLRAEAYGPVVLRPKNVTWRARKSEGGGCLYDYACHAIDLVNFLVGEPRRVGGTVLNTLFSRDVEDEVYSTLYFADGLTGQIAANWSDESHRKMSTKLSLWGTNGRITVDRQEVQMYIRDPSLSDIPVKAGWSILYTTELSQNPFYYLRGEEYSAQIDHFVQAIRARDTDTISTFASAVATDRIAAMMVRDAASAPADTVGPESPAAISLAEPRGLFARARARLAK
jgi:predicted dehydrogenase